MRTFNSNSNTLNQDLLKILKDTHSGIIFCRGIPGSGKTTWAKEFVSANSNLVTRINKDDFRAMLSLGKFSSAKEDLMNSLRIQAVKTILFTGKWAVLDDTNLTNGSFAKYNELTQNVICVDFTNVSVEECIKRDVGRTNAVGKDVILKLWESSLPKIVQDQTLPKTVIYDLDGTLALNTSNRSAYDSSKYGNDTVDYAVHESLLLNYNHGNTVIILSGREGTPEGKANTIKWLNDNQIPYHHLFMREHGDHRKDDIVKKEIYLREIQNKYFTVAIYDDRPCVLRMWRSLSLKTFNCGNSVEF